MLFAGEYVFALVPRIIPLSARALMESAAQEWFSRSIKRMPAPSSSDISGVVGVVVDVLPPAPLPPPDEPVLPVLPVFVWSLPPEGLFVSLVEP